MVQRISQQLARSRHVGKAIVLALDGVVDARGELDRANTQVYVPNEFVARETAKTRNLLFGASINPLRKDALARLDWAVANGAKLVKWIPSIMRFDPADPRLAPSTASSSRRGSRCSRTPARNARSRTPTTRCAIPSGCACRSRSA